MELLRHLGHLGLGHIGHLVQLGHLGHLGHFGHLKPAALIASIDHFDLVSISLLEIHHFWILMGRTVPILIG